MVFRRNSKSIISSTISRYVHSIDILLFLAVAALAFFSIVNLVGIVGFDDPLVRKQVQLVIAGILVMTLFSFFDYRFFRNHSILVVAFYLLTILLLFTTFFSREVRGIQAWVFFGNYSFEPSELAKLALIILLAKYFSQRHIYINAFVHVLVSGIYFLIPTTLILLQPDLGSAIILAVIWVGILIVSGINRKQVFSLVILAVLASYGSWLFALKDYQKDRIISFVDPYRDPKGSGYNLIQSKIAIGSGYIWGNGWSKGAQAKLGFLPEAHNDFAFASAAEQFGLVGSLAILAVVGVILSRILQISIRAHNNFAKIFSLGLALFFFSHVAINVSANIGLLPITGLPFPFLSFGGSNMITLMIGFGILQSIKRHD